MSGIVILKFFLGQVFFAREADVVKIPDSASSLVSGIMDRQDDRFDRKIEEIADEKRRSGDVPIMEVKDVDRLSLKFQIFRSRPGKIEEAGDIVLASVDFAAMEIAGRVPRIEEAEADLFAFGRPHRVSMEISLLKAFEIRNFHINMAQDREVDEVVFRKDRFHFVADPLQLSGKAYDDLSQPACLGDWSELCR